MEFLIVGCVFLFFYGYFVYNESIWVLLFIIVQQLDFSFKYSYQRLVGFVLFLNENKIYFKNWNIVSISSYQFLKII